MIRRVAQASPFVVLVAIALVFGGIVYAANSYRVGKSGASLAVTEHGVCKVVKNNNGNDIFVPTKTSNEWSLFRTNAKNVTLSNCGPIQTILWPYTDDWAVPAGSTVHGEASVVGKGVYVRAPAGATTMTVQIRAGKGNDRYTAVPITNPDGSMGIRITSTQTLGGSGAAGTLVFPVAANERIFMKFVPGGLGGAWGSGFGGKGAHISNLDRSNVWATAGGGGGGGQNGNGASAKSFGASCVTTGLDGCNGLGAPRAYRPPANYFAGYDGGGYSPLAETSGKGGAGMCGLGCSGSPTGTGGGGGYGGGSASSNGGGSGGTGSAGQTSVTSSAPDLSAYPLGAIRIDFY